MVYNLVHKYGQALVVLMRAMLNLKFKLNATTSTADQSRETETTQAKAPTMRAYF
jgi:hypothetical protein